MITIENLHAQVEGKKILNGIDFDVKPGEVHAIMGPNGSGKSTLSSVIAGHHDYEVTEGTMLLEGEDLSEMKCRRARSQRGFSFLSIPSGNSWRKCYQLYQNSHQCKSKSAWIRKHAGE
tara:strand:- start:319 stop:675 length:357 start_codon:yes stop_codon:yes gene_type:complete